MRGVAVLLQVSVRFAEVLLCEKETLAPHQPLASPTPHATTCAGCRRGIDTASFCKVSLRKQTTMVARYRFFYGFLSLEIFLRKNIRTLRIVLVSISSFAWSNWPRFKL